MNILLGLLHIALFFSQIFAHSLQNNASLAGTVKKLGRNKPQAGEQFSTSLSTESNNHIQQTQRIINQQRQQMQAFQQQQQTQRIIGQQRQQLQAFQEQQQQQQQQPQLVRFQEIRKQNSNFQQMQTPQAEDQQSQANTYHIQPPFQQEQNQQLQQRGKVPPPQLVQKSSQTQPIQPQLQQYQQKTKVPPPQIQQQQTSAYPIYGYSQQPQKVQIKKLSTPWSQSQLNSANFQSSETFPINNSHRNVPRSSAAESSSTNQTLLLSISYMISNKLTNQYIYVDERHVFSSNPLPVMSANFFSLFSLRLVPGSTEFVEIYMTDIPNLNFDFKDNSQFDGSLLYLSPRNERATSQRFRIVASISSYDFVHIQAMHSKKCLQVASNGTIQQFTCANVGSQLFSFTEYK